MEAASARMAARDRYAGFTEPATTPLQRYIQNAVDPQNYEPNLALDLEIADLINSKKGSAPREAAVAIVGHVNNRNPNISLLSLALLDICVKNCGYPFHLQISTKDFLNELVRRFPERPPMRYSRVQSKILELIEEWRSTICQTSKYKEDLGFIRDMHRLLSYKGYTFPAVKREDAAVLNSSDTLKSAEEMEEEERSAQSAKLQELIRRGTPHDLQEANRLMKVIAGFDTRHKTDYRAKAAEEVSKIQQKAKILEEMLASYNPADKHTDESAEELSNALASAQPKIQKMCEEESEDHEAVAKLFEINDSIHRTQERYKLMKQGDIEGAARIPKGTLGTSGAGVTKGPGNELSLIDFGPADASNSPNDQTASAASARGNSQQPQSLENDLLGLSLGDNSANAGGQITLGMSASPPPGPANPASAKQNIMNSFNLPQQQQQAGTPPQAAFPQLQQQSAHSRGQSFAAMQSQPATAATLAAAAAPVPAPTNDPFAALDNSRTASPFQFQQAARASPAPSKPGSAPAPHLSQPIAPTRATQGSSGGGGGGGGDDDWTFSSALPDAEHEITVTHSAIHVAFLVSRPPGVAADEVLIKSSVSNNTAQPVSDFTFQAAVVKSMQLRMEPQTSRQLSPQQRSGIAQVIRLRGVAPGQAAGVKVRWKASYWVGSERREEQGEIPSLGIP